MISNFAKDDSPFVCAFCGKQVSPLGYESRNHCPYCLYGVHADVGSEHPCRGLQHPVDIDEDVVGYKITYECTKCGKISINKTADDDSPKQIIRLIEKYGNKKLF